MKKYDIAAYVWPSYTGDEPRSRIFWEEGIGEWQTVKSYRSPEKGYRCERKTLWGYCNEADPFVMNMQIEAALHYGVNVFIYDWYWYDGRPFLENCLDDGFLKAANTDKMKFYIMWANHDANYTWDIRNSDSVDADIWQGKVDRKQFEIIGKRWIDRYFLRNNYYKIDGKPVVSIYEMNNFVSGLGGVNEASDALAWLEKEAKKAGLPGVHYQFVRWDGKSENLTGVDGGVMATGAELTEKLGFSSLTHYQFVHFADMSLDYTAVLETVKQEWEAIDKEYRIPYFPHVSVGWDNNPRFRSFRGPIAKNNTPEHFADALRMAKAYADRHNLSLITVNSWNEWTETSYLEPDSENGYGYLEAVKKVFVDENQ